MKPFNMHFNKTGMLELKCEEGSKLVFNAYRKLEASLEYTFLKISFQDLGILDEIKKHNLELIRSRIARYE
jgi:hypothetical protein